MFLWGHSFFVSNKQKFELPPDFNEHTQSLLPPPCFDFFCTFHMLFFGQAEGFILFRSAHCEKCASPNPGISDFAQTFAK